MESGLLAGLFLSVPAIAAEGSKVTGRVVVNPGEDDEDRYRIEIYLTNHGPEANDVHADSGEAMLDDRDVRIGGQSAWIMQMGMLTRGGPRLEWMPLPVDQEVLVGTYWTALENEGSDEELGLVSAAQSTEKPSKTPALSGTVVLTLRTGELKLELGSKTV